MKLIAITDDRHQVLELASKIMQIQNVVDFIHIREKKKSARELIRLLELLLDKGVPKDKIVFHDRLDAALLSGIRNIHLPGHGLPTKQVRAKFPFMRIGCSVHSFEEAKQSEEDGADYVLYGHVFETNSKAGLAPRGVKELEEIKKRLVIPVYAIGGITADRVDDIHVDGIAVMSGLFSAENPKAAAMYYLEKCKERTMIGEIL
ncbi:thiazole tautomerase TenI [Neobacillus mesonae]|uniref:thiazole tautomerase TenI n=1 Tax=Neobacillus mesonae TaxID=1193713 RepID=UPI00203D1719|nr:thiazole tautomerase TenI [Neobacillus mesonae]MCM3571109.1 thiazole tautomerase TenI [Neobacillus mesonae]